MCIRDSNTAGRVGDAVNPMLQPVHGDIGVKTGIVDDARKVKNENEPQGLSLIHI